MARGGRQRSLLPQHTDRVPPHNRAPPSAIVRTRSSPCAHVCGVARRGDRCCRFLRRSQLLRSSRGRSERAWGWTEPLMDWRTTGYSTGSRSCCPPREMHRICHGLDERAARRTRRRLRPLRPRRSRTCILASIIMVYAVRSWARARTHARTHRAFRVASMRSTACMHMHSSSHGLGGHPRMGEPHTMTAPKKWNAELSTSAPRPLWGIAPGCCAPSAGGPGLASDRCYLIYSGTGTHLRRTLVTPGLGCICTRGKRMLSSGGRQLGTSRLASCHICTGTGPTRATSAPRLGWWCLQAHGIHGQLPSRKPRRGCAVLHIRVEWRRSRHGVCAVDDRLGAGMVGSNKRNRPVHDDLTRVNVRSPWCRHARSRMAMGHLLQSAGERGLLHIQRCGWRSSVYWQCRRRLEGL